MQILHNTNICRLTKKQTNFRFLWWLFSVTLLIPIISLASNEQKPDEALLTLLRDAANDTSSFEDRFDAEVWLMDMSQRLEKKLPGHAERVIFLKHAHFEAKRSELAPELVLAIIEVESNFDRWAISSAGAQGLMQVMPFWLKEIGRPDDNLFDVQTNLRLGCTILKYYLDKANGDLTSALARYNGSYGSAKYPELVFKALNNRWFRL